MPGAPICVPFMYSLIWWFYCINADYSLKITTFALLECFFDMNSWSKSLYRTVSKIYDMELFLENSFLQKNGSGIKGLIKAFEYW